ncbi:FIG016425: Soluble lytic murein transglycosylase and related regulatory proteins (some contain LysM/invasin domains) [hydrothermal vent metagenome]|uniref:FIG016425: Soluble lytic murein transglycosylase and related regulatory proteins (Some contain LysM/invasin domains) n=1 Tax=hydrothermal vent metagenome TaxID=652676 RepID=A0A3B0SMJ5_9ZZZZ
MYRLTSIICATGVALFFTAALPVQSSLASVTGKAVTNFNLGVKKKTVRKTGKRRSVRRIRGGRPAIVAAVRRHARAAGVPIRIALSVVQQESSFRPRARGRAGEIGLMQLKCSTARGMGYRGSCGGLYKVSTNLTYGMRYLRKALRRGSVAYYNAGIGAKRLPRAARRYARQVNRRL